MIVDAVNITSDSLILQWLEPHDNNAPLTGYRIDYRTLDSSTIIEVVPQTSHLVTGLQAAVTYHFVIQALNNIGASSSSPVFNVTTLEAGKTILRKNIGEI